VVRFDDKLKPDSHDLPVDSVVTRAVDVLIGVDAEAADLLGQFGIRTVFDLAVSQVFTAAQRLAAPRPGDPMVRFGQTPSDLLDERARPQGLAAIESQPVADLRGIGRTKARRIREVLGITTIHELGHWPPFLAAHEVVRGDLGSQPVMPDPGVPSELVPRFNEFPTEQFNSSVYSLDPAGNAAELQDLNGPLDHALLEAPDDKLTPLTGAVVRYVQSWMPVGLTLGKLLHSLALAPGESTRIAMIDWSRRQGVRTSEDISQSEALSNSMMHSRSISEVTRAVASEAQGGFSTMNANSTVSNNAYSSYGLQNGEEAFAAAATGAAGGAVSGAVAGGAAGGGAGAILDIAALGGTLGTGTVGGVLIGGGGGALIGGAAGGIGGFLSTAEFGSSSESSSRTATDVVTTTSSSGRRNLAADMAQNVMDRTQQHASSVRNKRASIVQEVWQEESETVTTRTVTNYNHMHALTVQYFEVVQLYAVTTDVAHVQRCLYVPVGRLDWTRDLIERYARILFVAALDPRVRTALLQPPGTIRLGNVQGPQLPADVVAELGASAPYLAMLERAATVFGGPVAASALEPWVIQGDATIDEAALMATFHNPGAANAPPGSVQVASYSAPIGSPARNLAGQRLGNLGTIAWRIKTADVQNLVNSGGRILFELVLKLRHNGESFEWRTPYVISQDLQPQIVGDEIHCDIAAVSMSPTEEWLLGHLNVNSRHYSRAVWRRVGEADLGALLRRYRYNNQALLDVIDPKPIAVSGPYLVFAYHGEDGDWPTWLREKGFNDAVERRELVPMPTGGVFAEAVQGRANAAELLDLSRFWNWQEPRSAPGRARWLRTCARAASNPRWSLCRRPAPCPGPKASAPLSRH